MKEIGHHALTTRLSMITGKTKPSNKAGAAAKAVLKGPGLNVRLLVTSRDDTEPGTGFR